jgi:hypothetical protein
VFGVAGDDDDKDSVLMSFDGSRIATINIKAKTVKLYVAQTGKELTTFKNATDVELSNDGKRALVELYPFKPVGALPDPWQCLGLGRGNRRQEDRTLGRAIRQADPDPGHA